MDQHYNTFGLPLLFWENTTRVLVYFDGFARIWLGLARILGIWMVWGGFGDKIRLKVTKTSKIYTFLLGIVVFPCKKTPEAAFLGSHILVCSQDICCVCSQDICIVSSQDICMHVVVGDIEM